MRNDVNSMSVILIIVAVLVSGCSHQLEIKNLRTYQSNNLTSLENKCSVGIIPNGNDTHSEMLIKSIGAELGKYGANVCMPYTNGTSRQVEAVASISIQPEYKGSGWNFLINFPGFLIFTPAWNGYVYKVNYDVNVFLTRGSNGEKIDNFSLPIHLNIRHADFNRTWTELSWFEVGAIALIGGIVFTQYDDNVSQLVVDKINTPVGDYIAQEIISRINNLSDLANSQ